MSAPAVSFDEFSSARRRARAAADASVPASLRAARARSGATGADDPLLASLALTRAVLAAAAAEGACAVLLLAHELVFSPTLEPLRAATGGLAQYVPSTANFFAACARFAPWALWLVSFAELATWVASTVEQRRAGGVAAVFSALGARPVRVVDACLVLFDGFTLVSGMHIGAALVARAHGISFSIV